MYKLLSRKLLGEKYSSAVRSLIIAAVIGASLHSMGKTIALAQSIIILTGIVFTGTIVIQLLSSKDNARTLRGLFAMPCDEKKTLWEYAAAVGAYTIITKTSLVAALLFAFTKLTAVNVLLFALSLIYAVFGGMTAFALFRRAPLLSGLIVAAGAGMAFLLPKGLIAAAVLAAADIVMIAVFSLQPLDSFRVDGSARIKTPSASSGKPRMLVLRYITRYMLANKNYLISSVVLIAAAVAFSMMAAAQGLKIGCGMGLAIVSMNTPLATIVSSNRGLTQKLSVLPGKTRGFFVPYGFVLFGYYMIAYALYLAAIALISGTADVRAVITAVLFSAQCAVFVPLLEDKMTITKWKTEPDLWHNPRKYIIPGALIIEGALIYML